MENKQAELAALMQLRNDLKEKEEIEESISFLQKTITTTKESAKSNAHYNTLPTNSQAALEQQLQKKHKKAQKVKRAVIALVAAAVYICLFFFWYVFLYSKPSELYSPELKQSYSGTYVAYYYIDEPIPCTLEITSCNKDASFDGTFVIASEDGIEGKCEISGKVLAKDSSGNIKARISAGDWIEEPSYLYNKLETMTVVFSDDCTQMRCDEYQMALFTEGFDSTLTDDLYTPELLQQTFSGPVGDSEDKEAEIAFTSCEQDGSYTGYVTIFRDNQFSKYEITGKVIQKHTFGAITLSVNNGVFVDGDWEAWTTIKLGIKNIMIYDQYQGLTWRELDLSWPCSVPNITESAAFPLNNPVLFILFSIVYFFALLFVISMLMKNEKIRYSKEENLRLEALASQDLVNALQNDKEKRKAMKKAENQAATKCVSYEQQLEKKYAQLNACKGRIHDNDILSNKEKDLNTVEFLIEKIETRRADSLKEALLLRDADLQRAREIYMRAERDHILRQEQMRRENEAYLNQWAHNMTVQQELRKQTREIEKMREEMNQ